MVNDYRLTLKEKRRQKFNEIKNNPYYNFLLFNLIITILVLINISSGAISTNRTIGMIIIYSIVGLGYSLLLGYAGLASLGTAGFMGLGAYMFGYLVGKINLPFGLSLLVALIIAVIIGIIVGFISLRIEGMYLAIITLGLSEILVELFKSLDRITGGPTGLSIKFPKLFNFSIIGLFEGISLNREIVLILLIIVLFLMMILTLNIINSPIGRAMLAMKNSESAAQAMGISLLKYRLLAFIIATLFALIGGVLYITYYTKSFPQTWSLALSLNILAAVILGGSKSIYGVISGCAVIFGLDAFVLQKISFFVNNPGSTTIFSGILIVIIVMFYPGGLTRMYYDLKGFVKRRIERRREYLYGKE